MTSPPTNPTPCTEWDVRALVHHLVDANRMVTAMARGEETPAGTGTDSGGNEPSLLEQLRATTDETRQALSAPGLFERIMPTPMGEQPGVTLAMVRIIDMYVHGWDIAVATGQPTGLDPDLAGYLDA